MVHHERITEAFGPLNEVKNVVFTGKCSYDWPNDQYHMSIHVKITPIT